MPQLEQIDTFVSQIFWFFLAFGVIYLFVSKIAVPKISDILKKRSNIISSDMEEAQNLKVEAEKSQNTFEENISGSKSKALSIMSEASKEAKNFYEDEIRKAELQIKNETESSEKDISFAKDGVLKELQSDASEYVGEILKKLAGIKVDKSKIEKIISEKSN